MLAHEDEILQKVLKQFDGIPKIEAFDILHKIEILLKDQQSPIQYKDIKNKEEQSFIKNAVVPIGKSGYCYLIDYCHFIKVYKFKSIYPCFSAMGFLYYAVYNEPTVHFLNKKNIEETFKDTYLKYVIREFLKDNKVKDRNSKTNRLLLLELLDQVDPEHHLCKT
ncbi:hypothetical protein [Aquimarina sp. RZ0]|uniref:hypothetical protein n=1 Tax=Aquimarina sp. RZ0 TaxID=2607730 RepID=UPI0011F3D2FD|nr:hypothetical protein [Aquimarina sp. RZ0]KAA1239371.1 hypothetical protein F0000_27360 [Aquimarina sp. RZ0]